MSCVESYGFMGRNRNFAGENFWARGYFVCKRPVTTLCPSDQEFANL